MGMLNQHICSAIDCDRGTRAKGMCMKHYMRKRKHGDTETTLVPQEQHGCYETPEYRAWQAMNRRCYTKTRRDYEKYGGRGITVCDRWRNSFINFHDDMGDRPSETHSIDRINNDLGYSPANCRWATKQQQVLNRRLKKPGRSGYYGVQPPKHKNGFQAAINCLSFIHIGSFDTPEEAAWMYDQWAMALHGDDANLNFEYV